jgi:hypothetical protein
MSNSKVSDAEIRKAIECGGHGYQAEILERILAERQSAANPCSLSEALNVLENWALHGNTLSGDDVLRFQALVSKIAPAAKGVTGDIVATAMDAWDAEFVRNAHLPDDDHRCMRAALEAIAPMLAKVEVPEGWKLVPIQPDERMLQVLWEFGMRRASWNDVLSAAPSPKEGT